MLNARLTRLTYGALLMCSASTVFSASSSSNNSSAPALPVLSSSLPLEITVSKDKPVTLDTLQHDFDDFSWQSFVALNWPANADGSPNNALVIGEAINQPVVWLHWKESRDIFLANGAKPPAWNQANTVPDVCKSIDPKTIPAGAIHLTQVGKTPNVLDESGEPFQTGPLIDQNGNYTRYEILTNETMFNFILDNNLYSKTGQKTFGVDVNFPASNSKTKQIGSVMLKAAWIKMGGKFDAHNYYTTMALVYNNPAEQHGVKAACKLEQVGLVGFHIAHKTQDEPQWIWSTFEHVANAPTQGAAPQLSAYNFYDPSCVHCAVNQPPKRPWNPANKGSKPTQVERVIPITADAKALNDRYHAALKAAVPNSVWLNYELVSTQWPTNAGSKIDPSGVPAPSFLANTTLETYIQGSVKQTSSSCMACHNNATTTNGKSADFTYLLQRAQ